jgi:hypothetical protein
MDALSLFSKAKNHPGLCKKFQSEIISCMHDFFFSRLNQLGWRRYPVVQLQQKIFGSFRRDKGVASFCRIMGSLRKL